MRPTAATTRGQDSRRRILEAALRVLRARGYNATTVDDLYYPSRRSNYEAYPSLSLICQR
jgi:hypothetical protein